jgi:hypothetical protein
MDRRRFNSPRNLLLALLVTLLTSPPALAQKCYDNVTRTAPDSRYRDNSDGTVTDLQTGMQWQQCSLGQSGSECGTDLPTPFTWEEALQQGDELNNRGGFAGHSDWRLPNREELESLVEKACYAPAINTTLFPNAGLRHRFPGYWSSSPDATNSDKAWVVYYDLGITNDVPRKYDNAVRLVRSGK